MMIKPSIDELSKKVDSRYTLVTMAAKRARMHGMAELEDETIVRKNFNVVTEAVEEIEEGRIGYLRRSASEIISDHSLDVSIEQLRAESAMKELNKN